MNDSEALTLQAFLAALRMQLEPLSDKVQAKLKAIAQSLEARVMDLHELALGTSTLELPYQYARLRLISTAAERGLGVDFFPVLPAASSEEIDNMVRDTGIALEEMTRVLEAIEVKLDRAPQILSAPDSVQAAREIYG